MIFMFIRRAVLIAAAAAACLGLAEWFGPAVAGAVWAITAALMCALGALLLRTSTLNRITWRNRTAGYLIPWGWRLNKGLLWPAALISWAVWTAIGLTAILLRPGPAEESPGVGLRVALFVAWVTDAAALLYLLGTIRQATPGGRVRSLWKLVAVIAVILAASASLHFGGLTIAALIVGGGPPAVIAGFAGLFVGVILTFGRNARWN